VIVHEPHDIIPLLIHTPISTSEHYLYNLNPLHIEYHNQESQPTLLLLYLSGQLLVLPVSSFSINIATCSPTLPLFFTFLFGCPARLLEGSEVIVVVEAADLRLA
jgi:hypothetical protein